MKRKEALFELIRSLTQSEKRFFKIYASRHTIRGKNNYVKLFEAIDTLPSYNETKLRNKIRGESFSKHLSAEKNYLYNLILECLNIYHKDSSVDRKIGNYINIAKILSEKKLDAQSIRIGEKAKDLSERYNRFENILTLMSLTKSVKFERDTLTESDLQSYYREKFSALAKLKTKLEYNKLYDELLLQRRQTGSIKNKKELDRLNAFYENPYLSDPSKINSFDSTMYFLLAQIEYSTIARNHENGRLYCNKLISLFEKHTEQMADKIFSYLYALRIFIGERMYEGQEEAALALKKISDIPGLIGKKAITKDVQVKIFETHYISITDIALRFHDYSIAIPSFEKMGTELKKFEMLMSPSANIVLKFNIACVYFGAGQYKQSLKWCNEVINNSPGQREDIHCDVRILSLLIHFELGNQLIIPSLMRSTYRYLYKNKRVYKFESIFLKYLRLFLRAETIKEQTILFSQFREELVPLLENKMENIIFNDIDLIGWIDKKIQRQ